MTPTGSTIGPSPAAPTPSVCAVAISYRPQPDALLALVAAVQPQVSAVVVVDNGSDPDLLAGLDPSVSILRQPTNIGLAAAQNIGIAWARRNGHTHVLLLDQDSLPAEKMVAALLEAHAQLREAGVCVAAVGPTFFDPREGTDAPFVRVAFPVSEKVRPQGEPFVRCDFLISSGALIPLEVLGQIGEMDPGLFIDNVDLEWSFRARARGFALYGVSGARMHHHLGDDRRSILFGARRIVTHPPIRLYYIMRNRTLLYRRAATPRAWIAQDLIRIPVKFALFAVLVGPRRQNVAMMLRGLADGIRGRTGALPASAVR